ncbi:MAG: IS5 family transposase [Cyanobacteria bacterium P01_E01_bin.48]
MGKQQKLTYKITNWRQYNEALVNRGSITVWFSEEALDHWEHPNDRVKVGRPFTYSDKAIECLLTIRELLKLPYRQTEGFSRSIVKLLDAEVAIPDYSSLAKRAGKLGVTLKVADKKGAIDIVVDSTGMKVYGEGEWKTRIHGKAKRRTWRKLHLAVDADTHQIVAEVLTENSSHDSQAVPALLEQIDQPVEKFYGDGGYDTWNVYDRLAIQGIEPIIAPQHNAKIKQHGNRAEAPLPRDEAIRGIRTRGRRGWKQEVGYHRRSLAETAVYRVKQTFGPKLKNRNLENQQTESRIRSRILNKFTKLGMPVFEWS